MTYKVETVGLQSRDAVKPRDLDAPESSSDAPQRREVQARLYVPAGVGTKRLAGVVVSQGLGGPRAQREYEYAERLAEGGMVAIVPDGFGSRGLGNNGDLLRAANTTTTMLLSDTFAALTALRRRPYVCGECIAVVGFSFGGMIAVLAAYEQMRRTFLEDEPGFAGHVSYYGCSIPRLDDPTTTGAPVMIMLGAKDRNVSVERTRGIAGDLEKGGSPTDLTVFDDAFHEWDGPDRNRFVPFNLRHLHLRIRGDGTIVNERTGKPIEDMLSRNWHIVRYGSFLGFRLHRDETVLTRSNRKLADFFSTHLGGHAGAESCRVDASTLLTALNRGVEEERKAAAA